MSKPSEILLLTGLGNDKVVTRQERFVEYLNKRRPVNAQIHVFPTKWQTAETFSEKWERLLKFTESYPNISLVYGISAGASLGMCLVPKMSKTTKYHFICGKILHPETIGPERKLRAPALFYAVTASETVVSSLDLAHLDMRCHSGYLDGVLLQEDMIVPNIASHRIAMITHSATISIAYLTVLRGL